VLHLIEGMRKAAKPTARAAAVAAFETRVTFVDPWLRKVQGIGPMRFACEVPLG
jgi:hypothetical protein